MPHSVESTGARSERFFVAIPVDGLAGDRILAAQPQLANGARLIGRDELHLTLHFLGGLTPEAARQASAALEELRFDAFPMTLEGVGSFSAADGAHALWVGVEPSAELSTLHCAIAESLSAAIGFKLEDRPYRPHITVARIGGAAAQSVGARFLTENADFHFAPLAVTEFALYTSHFADDVPRYQIRVRYAFPQQ